MKISEHCYAVTGLYFIPPWTTNAGFIVGKKKTLVIDAGFGVLAAQTIYGYAHAIQPNNEMLLINSEKHLDHIGGNSYFEDHGVPIYGHKSIQRQQTDLTQTAAFINQTLSNPVRRMNNEGYVAFEHSRIVNPDHKISKDLTMELGECRVDILCTPGHTQSNLTIYHEQDQVLFCGDTILNGFIPNLEEGNPEEWKLWLLSLQKISQLQIQLVVPGHGNVIHGAECVSAEIERTAQVIQKALSANCPPTAMG